MCKIDIRKAADTINLIRAISLPNRYFSFLKSSARREFFAISRQIQVSSFYSAKITDFAMKIENHEFTSLNCGI